MNKNLANVLAKISELLVACERHEDAAFINLMRIKLEQNALSKTEYNSIIDDLKKFMHPRGVFCDSSLVPNKNSGMTLDDAYKLQWDLADQFWEEFGE